MTNRSLACCYTAPSLGASRSAIATAAPGRAGALVNHPVAASATVWHEGFFRPGVDQLVVHNHPSLTHPVPPWSSAPCRAAQQGCSPAAPGPIAIWGCPPRLGHRRRRLERHPSLP